MGLSAEEKAELREERVAILIFDGSMGEEEAQELCDMTPELYGKR